LEPYGKCIDIKEESGQITGHPEPSEWVAIFSLPKKEKENYLYFEREYEIKKPLYIYKGTQEKSFKELYDEAIKTKQGSTGEKGGKRKSRRNKKVKISRKTNSKKVKKSIKKVTRKSRKY